MSRTFYYNFSKTIPEEFWKKISLDRIDNTKGYTKDNVIFVCLKANTIKSISTIDELCKIADFYKNLVTNFNTTIT